MASKVVAIPFASLWHLSHVHRLDEIAQDGGRRPVLVTTTSGTTVTFGSPHRYTACHYSRLKRQSRPQAAGRAPREHQALPLAPTPLACQMTLPATKQDSLLAARCCMRKWQTPQAHPGSVDKPRSAWLDCTIKVDSTLATLHVKAALLQASLDKGAAPCCASVSWWEATRRHPRSQGSGSLVTRPPWSRLESRRLTATLSVSGLLVIQQASRDEDLHEAESLAPEPSFLPLE